MSTFRSYAEEFRRALNLYSETPDELVEAAREGRLDQELSRWLTPDDENFPGRVYRGKRRSPNRCNHAAIQA